MHPDYSYLQVPESLYSLKPQQSEALEQKNGKIKRRLFYRVPYTSTEMQRIQEFKEYASKHQKNIECSIQDTLRYLYSYEFNFQESCEKIGIFREWQQNSTIQGITKQAEKILKSGVVSTFGRDRENRPIIFMKVGEINLKENSLEDYYSAINAVLTVVTKVLFVKGVIENYCFVIDMGNKNFTSLPVDTTLTIIKKLTVIYSMLLGRMLIINTNSIIRLTYYAISKFFHPETKKKIKVFGSHELNKMTEFIEHGQLEFKNGGCHPNLTTYWPPKLPDSFVCDNSNDQTIYHSVVGQNPMFMEENTYENGCCSTECNIF